MLLSANGLSIEVEVDGPADGQPLLLVMGLGMQLTSWPPELVQALVARGFRVIRFDNRDAGLSQGFDAAGRAPLARALAGQWLRLPPPPPAYTLADMARDAAGVLDALGVASAHVCGASMGGMVAQHLGFSLPQRVRSLTLMMTTSGARHLPQPRARVQLALASRPMGAGEERVAEHLTRLLLLIGSPGYAADAAAMRPRILAHVRRGWRPQGTERQLHAIVADGDRSPRLGAITASTLVLHGEADPLLPLAHGQHLAQQIPGARLITLPGWGHDLPLALVPRLAQLIEAQAHGHAPD